MFKFRQELRIDWAPRVLLTTVVMVNRFRFVIDRERCLCAGLICYFTGATIFDRHVFVPQGKILDMVKFPDQLKKCFGSNSCLDRFRIFGLAVPRRHKRASQTLMGVAPDKYKVEKSERYDEGSQVEDEQQNRFEPLVHVSD